MAQVLRRVVRTLGRIGRKATFIRPAPHGHGMQKAQSSDILESLEERTERRRAEVQGWVRDLGFLEAWKKVAQLDVHRIFSSIKMTGPYIPDEYKKYAVEEIYRHTLWKVCDGMTDEEWEATWRENHDAMEEYALVLAEKAAAEYWKHIPFDPR